MKKEYLDHVITLNLDNRFAVNGPAIQHQVYDSYAQAQDAIVKAVRLRAREGIPNLELDVLHPDGKTVLRLRTIHGTTRALLFDKPIKEELDYVYAVSPKVSELLKAYTSLEKQLDQIKKKLNLVEIKVKRGYGRIGDAEQLMALLKGVRDDHARVTENIKKL